MSWKKHFRVVQPITGNQPAVPTAGRNTVEGNAASTSKFSSYLPEVYAGHPNRIQRYYQYEDMDRDSDISVALDTIADFCTQSEEQANEPFTINYNGGEATETEVKLLKSSLEKWVRVNDFRSRLWYIFRNTIKNGDSFFVRDPQTGEWLWVDQFSVLLVKVDEENGKDPEEYVVRGLDYAKQIKFASSRTEASAYNAPLGTTQAFSSRQGSGMAAQGSFALPGSHIDVRTRPGQPQSSQDLHVLKAEHVVHLSLSVGMDVNWPFGQSVMEPIFKTYKQKELLEDSIIIYRVQRAPERRIFYVDVGTMPPVRAKAHIQAIKNEIHQRRIPNRTGGGTSIMDAAYNPLSIMEDFFFAQSAEGRGSKVETLPGGDNLGEIGDLDFFTRKLARGLRIPSSYLALADETANTSYNDGKLGAAIIQEFRFNKYCMRLQNLLVPVFDREFKQFVADSGISVDNDLFELQFNPPQNFTKYRQIEIDSAQVSVYQQVAENKKLAERFKLQRFLNLTEEEIVENERLWKEENAARLKKKNASPAGDEGAAGLSSIGIRPGGDEFGDMALDDPSMDGAEGEGEAGGADPMAMGGAPGSAPGGMPGGIGGPPPGGAAVSPLG